MILDTTVYPTCCLTIFLHSVSPIAAPHLSSRLPSAALARDSATTIGVHQQTTCVSFIFLVHWRLSSDLSLSGSSTVLTAPVIWSSGDQYFSYIVTTWATLDVGRTVARGGGWIDGVMLITVDWQSIGLVTEMLWVRLTPGPLQATLSKLLTYCVLRPTQPPTLSGTGNE